MPTNPSDEKLHELAHKHFMRHPHDKSMSIYSRMVRKYGPKAARNAIKAVIETERLIDLDFAEKVRIYWATKSIRERRVPPETLSYREIVEYQRASRGGIQGRKAEFFILDDFKPY